ALRQHVLSEQVFVAGVGVIGVLADEEDLDLLRLLFLLVLVVGEGEAAGEQDQGQGEGALEQVFHGVVLRCGVAEGRSAESVVERRGGGGNLRRRGVRDKERSCAGG